MGFISNRNLGAVVILAIVIGFFWTSPAFSQAADTVAQVTDTTAVLADTTATDSAAVAADTVAAAAPTAAAGATPTATTVEAGKPSIAPQVYKNFFYGLLLVFLVCVLVGVVGKIIQVYELTRRMNGKDTKFYLNDINAWLFLIGLVLGLYGVYWSYVHHGAQSMRDAATLHGDDIDTMFMITTVICTIVLVVMHIALFGFAYKYRATPTRKAYFYPHNNTVEKIWTIVPAVVLTVLVLFGFFTWRGITNVSEEDQKSALNIEVVGEQFTWTVRYAGRDGKLGQRNFKLTTPLNGLGIDFNDKSNWDDQLGSEIVLPVNKPVRIQIGSKDILHSFYIPDFRVQMNAVPGMKTFFQFTPTITTQEMRDRLDDHTYNYVMLCAKICGGGHYNMQKTVRVVTEEEYQTWLAEQPYFFTEDLQKEFKAAQVVDDGMDTELLANAN